MARAPKPVALQSSHLTNEEKELREEKERKLKGNNDKVYTPPRGMRKAIKDIYTEIVEELREADILNNLDIELITTTSFAIYRMRQARKALDKDGLVFHAVSGPKKSPYVQIEKDYQAIFHSGCLQLGLSPSSRSKLALMAIEAEQEEDDDGF